MGDDETSVSLQPWVKRGPGDGLWFRVWEVKPAE